MARSKPESPEKKATLVELSAEFRDLSRRLCEVGGLRGAFVEFLQPKLLGQIRHKKLRPSPQIARRARNNQIRDVVCAAAAQRQYVLNVKIVAMCLIAISAITICFSQYVIDELSTQASTRLSERTSNEPKVFSASREIYGVGGKVGFALSAVGIVQGCQNTGFTKWALPLSQKNIASLNYSFKTNLNFHTGV